MPRKYKVVRVLHLLHGVPFTDDNGVTYPDVFVACEVHNNINVHTFKYRYETGMHTDRAFEAPINSFRREDIYYAGSCVGQTRSSTDIDVIKVAEPVMVGVVTPEGNSFWDKVKQHQQNHKESEGKAPKEAFEGTNTGKEPEEKAPEVKKPEDKKPEVKKPEAEKEINYLTMAEVFTAMFKFYSGKDVFKDVAKEDIATTIEALALMKSSKGATLDAIFRTLMALKNS
jgi:hypothetical protein